MRHILFLLMIFFLQLKFANAKNLIDPIKSKFQLTGYQKNQGQITDQFGNLREDVKYIYNEPGFKLILKKNSFSYEVYLLNKNKVKSKQLHGTQKVKSSRIDIVLNNTNQNVEIIEGPHLQFYSNHFTKNRNIVTPVKYFSKIIYKNIYDKIDLIFSICNGKPKYDFVIYPEGNVEDICLEYRSEKSKIEIVNNQIEINLGYVTLYDKLPISYFISLDNQNNLDESNRHKADVLYKKVNNKFYFKVDKYERNKILVIDPSISAIWGRFFGGENIDEGAALGIDAANNIYITGFTYSFSNIATSGAYDNTYNSNIDAYIAKFDSNGVLKWGTYFGGNGQDRANDLIIDNLNNIVIVGITESNDTISTSGAYQRNYKGMFDGFICKFDSSGILIWSTYYGGNESEDIHSVDIDNSNNIYVIGETSSNNYISSNGSYQLSVGGGTDAFIVKFDPSGNRIWSTYYGGFFSESGAAIAIDHNNDVLITGVTASTANISTNNSYQANFGGGNSDAFISKFNSNGILIWATYYGGSGDENNYWNNYFGIEVDNNNNIVTVGITSSKNNIASGGAHQTNSNSTDGFVVKLNSNGDRLWGTYYGGSQFDGCNKLFIDNFDNIFVTGITKSTDNISTVCGYNQNYLGGSQDGFILKLSSTGVRQFGAYIGGSDYDESTDICVDSKNHFIVMGSTNSTDKIATNNFISTLNLSRNAFFIKFKEYIPIQPIISVTPSTRFCNGDGVILKTNVQKSYLWSNGNTTQQIVTFKEGNYSVKVIDSSGCSMNSNSISLYEIKPTINVSNMVLCKGDSILLTASVGNNYLWSTGESSMSIVISDPGVYSVTNTDSTGCIATSNVITIPQVIPVFPDLGRDTILCIGKDLPLSAYVAGAKYAWSTGDTTSHIIVKQEGKYSINLFYYSCPAVSDTILINYISEIEYSIPNLITPNNDRKNDDFVLKSTLPNTQVILPNTQVYIYNIWGELVYKNLNYNNNWQAEEMPDGVYYFLIKNDHYCMKDYKGWLHVLK